MAHIERSREFLACRLRKRHRFPDPWERGVKWAVEVDEYHRRIVVITLPCRSCKTERVNHIVERTGELVRYQYHWPDGYLLTPDEDRLDSDEIRLRFVVEYLPEGLK